MQPGYGPTHFLSSETPQPGEHAALDQPRRAMLDALHIGQAFLAGFDCGGRAACVVSGSMADRVRGLASLHRLPNPGRRLTASRYRKIVPYAVALPLSSDPLSR